MPNIDDMILRTVTANASAAAHREHAPHDDHHS
jgi:hypothetical protein